MPLNPKPSTLNRTLHGRPLDFLKKGGVPKAFRDSMRVNLQKLQDLDLGLGFRI